MPATTRVRRTQLQFALTLLCCICVLGFMAVTGTSLYLWAEHSGRVPSATTVPGSSIAATPNPTPSAASSPTTPSAPTGPVPPAPPTYADLRRAVDEAIEATIGHDETLLDKLVLLVGIYSTILSFLALATVLISRSDFKDQLAAAQKQIADLENEARKDIAAFKAQIEHDFPFISELQASISDLVLKLEAKYPENEDWNLPQPANDPLQIKERQQDTEIDEAQILAISVIIHDQAKLVKLYLALARSYMERFHTGQLTDDDASRAYLYAGRAIRSNPGNSDAYLLRGTINLIRYDNATAALKNGPEYQDMFTQARSDLTQARNLDPLNAGAYYNLALISLNENNLNEAVRISEELLAAQQDVGRRDKEKYFPDVYVNLACFFARLSRETTDKARKSSMEARVLEVCTEGKRVVGDLKSSKAVENFSASLQRELDVQGDFFALPLAITTALTALV